MVSSCVDLFHHFGRNPLWVHQFINLCCRTFYSSDFVSILPSEERSTVLSVFLLMRSFSSPEWMVFFRVHFTALSFSPTDLLCAVQDTRCFFSFQDILCCFSSFSDSKQLEFLPSLVLMLYRQQRALVKHVKPNGFRALINHLTGHISTCQTHGHVCSSIFWCWAKMSSLSVNTNELVKV